MGEDVLFYHIFLRKEQVNDLLALLQEQKNLPESMSDIMWQLKEMGGD